MIGNRLTNAASGFLSARTSRRGFLVRSALVGSAFAFAGCGYATKKGPAYQRLTDCAPSSMCRADGYTEFCCSINGGYNCCPEGSIPAGWWKAGSSTWCNGGPRWYVDCNQVSHPYPECRCGPSCDNRKVYCNYFRYGNCNNHVAVGPIACRLTYCDTSWFFWAGCTGPEMHDNSTAGHAIGCMYGPSCLPPPPPPPTTAPPTTAPPTTTAPTTTTTTTAPTTTTTPP